MIMETNNLIAAEDFCTSHQVDFSFITSLQQLGIVEVTTIQEAGFINGNQLPKLEQCVRLHYDLDINPEGIDAITHLLDRIKTMQAEIQHLQNRLRAFESLEFGVDGQGD
jgi:hypothetical protein